MLNSVAIIEAPVADSHLYYMGVVLNLLRKNSAVVHQTLATPNHRMLERYYQVGKFSSNASQ